MEVRINRDNKVEIVKLKDPTGKHQREWFNQLIKGKEGQIEDIMSFLDYRDKLILELADTKLTKEELENMSLVEKNKITKAIEACFTLVEDSTNKQSGFTKS